MTLAIPTAVVAGAASPNNPPLDPSAAQAREQLLQELAKLGYQESKPSWVDDVVNWVSNLFESLFRNVGSPGGGPSLILVVIAIIVIAAAVVGFVLFGLPRINRRSSLRGGVFADDDNRSSGDLRSAAERAADSGDFTTAIEEGFRAIARGLAERTVLTTFPGTTAHGFAREARRAFPEFGDELAFAATAFDAVRYLGSAGTEEQWLRVRDLEAGLRTTRPELEAVDA
jgi:hypothetical protein